MPVLVLPMKFERWNKDTNKFELVDLSPEEFEELLLGFSLAECECLIEDRIESMVTEVRLVLDENKFFYKYD